MQDFAVYNPVVQNMLLDAAEGVLLDSFIALIVGLIATVTSIFGVQVVSRILSEESSGHAESVLRRPCPVFWIVLAGMFGGLLQFPDWVIDLSSFGHVPLVPAEAMQWGPVVVLAVLVLVLIVIGIVGLRRRDLTSATCA